MTTLRAIGHKLATGTLTVGGMAAVDAITAWTLQSDMVIPWQAPEVTTIPSYPQEITALNGKVSGLGFMEFQWEFSYFSFGAIGYLLNTFLTTSSARVLSKAATVLTYDDTNTAMYFNCTLNYPTYKPQIGGWADVVLRFTYATQIT